MAKVGRSQRKKIPTNDEERGGSATETPLTDKAEVTRLVDPSRDITELMAAQEQAQRQATELRLAAEISKATTTLLDPDQLIQQAVDLIADRFGLYYAGLFLVDDANEWAILRAGTGNAGQSMLQDGHRLTVGGRSMIGQCVANAKAGIALDVGAEPVRFDNPLLPETRSELALPLTSRGRAIGALTIQSIAEAAFNEQDIAALQTMADQLANAIENARLFQERERRIQEQATITEIGQAVASTLDMEALFETVHREVSRLFDASSFYIASYKEGSDEWESAFHVERGEHQLKARYSIQRGLTGYIIRTRQPLLLHTRQENLDFAEAHGLSVIGSPAASWLAVPLIAADRCVGVMCVQNYDRENLYGDRDLAVFGTIAGQVAVALDNARLLAETQDRARELAVLNEMGRTLTGMLDLASVVQSIRRFASQLVDTSNFFVALYDAERDTISFPLYLDGEDTPVNMPARRAGKGMSEHVIRTRQPLLVTEHVSRIQAELGIETIGQPAESWLGVPMIVGERPIGLIAVQSYTTPRVYGEHDRDLLLAVASQAAIAIQNARLFGEQQHTAGMLGERLRQLDCLSDIGLRAQEAPPLPEFLEWVAERIPAAMRYPDVCLSAVEFEGHIYGAPDAAVGNHGSTAAGEPRPTLLQGPATGAGNESSVPRQMVQSLRIGAETVGRVYVTYPETLEFADEESALLGDIVRRVSGYVENRRLLEETEQASRRLAEERAVLRTLIDSLPDPTFVKDRNSRFILSNMAHVQMLGAESEEEIVGETDFDRFPQELAAGFYTDEQEIMRSGQPLINREEYIADEQGDRRWLWTTKVPLRDDQGRITGLVGINRDITGRKRSEEVLQRRGAQLECLSDIGQRIGEAQPVPEFLQWVAERIPAAFQYPELCLAAVDFEGTTYGTTEALQQPRQLVQSLRRGREIVGRLCVAYREERDFLDEESALLGDMARRVSGYIENRRLFEQTQAALAEVEATHRRYLQTQWQSYLQRRADLQQAVFIYDRAAATAASPGEGQAEVRAVSDLWRPEMEQALNAAAPARVEAGDIPSGRGDGGDDGTPQRAGLAVPIVLRGQPIGVLGIENPDASRRWSDEEVVLLQEVGQQLALALENARLFEETQRRAERERLITNITARIRSSTDMLGVLETTATELGKALGTSRVLVQLAPADLAQATGEGDTPLGDGEYGV